MQIVIMGARSASKIEMPGWTLQSPVRFFLRRDGDGVYVGGGEARAHARHVEETEQTEHFYTRTSSFFCTVDFAKTAPGPRLVRFGSGATLARGL